MKKVLLVHPWIEDFSAHDFWIKPIGLLAIGTLLKSAGIDVTLIDCVDRVRLNAPDQRYGKGKIPAREMSKPKILEKIPRRFKRYGMDDPTFLEHAAALGRPDLILVTCMMTYWYTGAFRAISMLRGIYPDVPIGLGGNYVSLCLSHAQKYSDADFLFPDKDLCTIVTRIKDILNVEAPAVPCAGFPADYSFYPEVRSIPLMTSQGCPYRCTYCAASRLYPAFVQRDPEQVVSEIECNAVKFRVRDFAFVDDALLVNAEEHFHRILQGINQRRLGLRFHLPNALHAGEITPETAELMFHAGFKTIRLGLDSASPAFQIRAASAKVDNQRFIQGVRSLQHAGFSASELGAYVLYGLPDQKEQNVLKTLCMAHDAGVRSYLATFSPVPQTPYFHKMAELDPRILHEPLLHNKHVSAFRNEKSYRRIQETANRMNHELVPPRTLAGNGFTNQPGSNKIPTQ